MKKKIALLVLCGATTICFGGCSGSGSSTSTPVGGSSQPAAVSTSTPAPTEEAQETLSVGDTADVDGVKVTLNSVAETEGTDIIKPEDGNTFVLCNFTIQNDSDADLTISSAMCFEAYCDDTSVNLDIMGLSTDEAQQAGQLDGDVASGKSMSGVVAYQVPVGYKKLEVSVQPNVLDANTADFVYEK